MDLRDVLEAAKFGGSRYSQAPDTAEEARGVIRAFIANGLASDVSSFADYAENEPTAIPESEWIGYCQDLAADIGAISGEERWPVYCIDWERAAADLAMDYSQFEYDGTTYYVRSY